MTNGIENLTDDNDADDLQSINSISLASWPLVHRPLSSGIVFVVLAAAAVVLGLLADRLAFGVLAYCVLMLVMWRLWLPVNYRISGNGIVQTVCGRDFHISWRAVGEVRFSSHGCILSRASFASPFASLQSIVLDYAGRTEQNLTRQELETVLNQLIRRYAHRAIPSRGT
jgi:hypothetical protein